MTVTIILSWWFKLHFWEIIAVFKWQTVLTCVWIYGSAEGDSHSSLSVLTTVVIFGHDNTCITDITNKMNTLLKKRIFFSNMHANIQFYHACKVLLIYVSKVHCICTLHSHLTVVYTFCSFTFQILKVQQYKPTIFTCIIRENLQLH